MGTLLHQFIDDSAHRHGDSIALIQGKNEISYSELARQVNRLAIGLMTLDLTAGSRIAIYLPKCPQAVTAFFAASKAGFIFIPINPLLKPEQVEHILFDSGASLLVTSGDRMDLLRDRIKKLPELVHILLTDEIDTTEKSMHAWKIHAWQALMNQPESVFETTVNSASPAAILYTSGSTGLPKGVVLSHGNMVTGALSVVEYLGNTRQDRLLAVLPFSFDYGLSQLTSAFAAGASIVLIEYLLPGDVIKAVTRHQITGLAAVPTLWIQLARLSWPEQTSLRYITSSGGTMPTGTTQALAAALPHTRIFLMYGLTEAFRSTFLPPDQLATRPSSIGKAVPHAEILVLCEDASPCQAGQAGELVHRGPLVAQGYWNDPALTAERFRPLPNWVNHYDPQELALWSGDQVTQDEAGYLYFQGRHDNMIKTSGYRVSPTELEAVLCELPDLQQAVALGVAHPMLGQAILLLVEIPAELFDEDLIRAHCRQHLPGYMQPAEIIHYDALPLNQNGKIDRPALAQTYSQTFAGLLESAE